jgi:hypothetical protein
MPEKKYYESIQCGCGAKVNSYDPQTIARFDEIHGSSAHQNLVLEVKLMKIKFTKGKDINV